MIKRFERILSFYDDESTREKMTVLDPWDAIVDDARNPDFEGLDEFLKPGRKYRLVITDAGPINGIDIWTCETCSRTIACAQSYYVNGFPKCCCKQMTVWNTVEDVNLNCSWDEWVCPDCGATVVGAVEEPYCKDCDEPMIFVERKA